MAARLYCPVPMHSGMEIVLPAHAARHAQVLRLQPGDAVELFHGGLMALQTQSAATQRLAASVNVDAEALPINHAVAHEADAVDRAESASHTTGWFAATISHMGRSEVRAHLADWHAPLPASGVQAHIVCGVPANERMDWLVEKATELGAASIQPVLTARSVVRLSGERAQKRVAHWQAIAVAACEQSGRTVVPPVLPLVDLRQFWTQDTRAANAQRWLLSLHAKSATFRAALAAIHDHNHGNTLAGNGNGNGNGNRPMIWLLSGPEGGLTTEEENAAIAQGWQPVSLGAYTLRAETAPLAVLAALGLAAG